MAPSLRRDGDVDRALDALVAGGAAPIGLEELTHVLDDLRALGGAAAPAPTAALTRFLANPGLAAGDAVTDLDVRRQRRAVRVGAAALTVAVLTLGSVGVAAAQGTLPDRAQDAVANAVSALTPFSVPRAQRDRTGHDPAGASPSPSPTPSAARGELRISRPAPQSVPPSGSSAPAGTASSVPGGGGDLPGNGPAEPSGDGASREASAAPAEPQRVATSSDGGSTSSSDGAGADPQPSSSPTEAPGDATGADLTGSVPAGDGTDGTDGTDVTASPDS